MTAQMLAYPFLFLAIFFQSFVLVTLLSEPSRKARRSVVCTSLPRVAIIVPCWNEAATVAATAESLLALDYPADKLEIILVDNASTDATPLVMAAYERNPRVKVLHESTPGKHNAVNAGIASTSADIVGCLDADSFVEPGALREMVGRFEAADIGAVTAAMSVHQPKNILQHMQNAEYIFGITRQNALSVVNGIHVTPGPFSLYRKSAVVSLGGFKHGHQTEDLEMALRLQRGGYRIANAPLARVYTKAPATLFKLIKQRTRWTSGYLRNVLNEYRDMFGNSKYGALGLITLPIGTITIGGAMLLFGVAIYELTRQIISFISVREGIPLAYALSPHAFGWFYLPGSVYTLLAFATVSASITMVIIGKKISKTPGSLWLGLISYLLLYGIVAPLWLLRASADVALGKKRVWR